MRRVFYMLVILMLMIAAGSWLRQSDQWILRTAGLNPAKLTAYRVEGKDGYMMVYSNETTVMTITHSMVSGVKVTRSKPKEWEPERNQNPGKP